MDTILKTNIAVRVGTDGYDLEEYDKEDGGDVQEVVKQKVLYTGPLSVTGSTQTLDGGESFDNWDAIEFHVNLTSDVAVSRINSNSIPVDFLANNYTSDHFSDVGSFIPRRLTATTFDIFQKTVASGNLIRIVGIKL